MTLSQVRPATATAEAAARAWPEEVAWRALSPMEFGDYRAHLLRLSEEDRRLRFQHPMSDEAIGRFVDQLDWQENRVLAVLNSAGEVIAAVQIALGREATAELAFSVDAAWRNRGLAGELFAWALRWARSQGIRRVCLSSLAENRSMLNLARKAGMSLTQEAGVSDAVLDLTSRPARRAARVPLAPTPRAAQPRRLFRPLIGRTQSRGTWSGALARWRTRLRRSAPPAGSADA